MKIVHIESFFILFWKIQTKYILNRTKCVPILFSILFYLLSKKKELSNHKGQKAPDTDRF